MRRAARPMRSWRGWRRAPPRRGRNRGRVRGLVRAGWASARLGKYWSIILLLGLAMATLADRRRGVYLRSAAPWLTIAAGIAGLAPHLVWLYAPVFKALAYALESHLATAGAALVSGLGYVVGAAGYLAAPILIAMAAAR